MDALAGARSKVTSQRTRIPPTTAPRSLLLCG